MVGRCVFPEVQIFIDIHAPVHPFLRDYNCGAFHTGVEVYGMEYVFQYYANEVSRSQSMAEKIIACQPDNNELSGISAQIPRTDSAYVYRTTVGHWGQPRSLAEYDAPMIQYRSTNI